MVSRVLFTTEFLRHTVMFKVIRVPRDKGDKLGPLETLAITPKVRIDYKSFSANSKNLKGEGQLPRRQQKSRLEIKIWGNRVQLRCRINL